MLLKQSTARNLHVFMTDSADHVSGKTGLTLTITASKDGAAFASISPTVTELASGWYSLALTTTHTNTLGDFSLHITSSGADPTDLARQVVSLLPGDAVTVSGDFSATMKTSIGTAVAASAVASVTGNVGGSVAGSVASVTGAVGSVTGAVGSVTGLTASDVGAIKTNTDKMVFTKTNELDVNIQSVNGTTVNGDGSTGTEWGP